MLKLDSKGVVPILVLIAAVAVIGFLAVTSVAPFKDKLLGSLFPKQSSHAAGAASDWYTVAANAQRTSWVSEEVRGDMFAGTLKVNWYRPIEAYIPPNAQIVAGNGLLYISTGRGLYAIKASDGSTVWRFDTELPLGNSPTILNGVVYVAGFDKKVYALNAANGAKKWEFTAATAGFRTNPLVLIRGAKTVIYIGSRDGIFYAIEDKGTSASQLWSFKTGGPIILSAAANKAENTIYFASNDNFAYALNSDTGAKIWQSPKLPGEGLHSYWPTVYTNPFNNKDYVVFEGSSSYRLFSDPGSRSIPCIPTELRQSCPYDWGAPYSVFYDKTSYTTVGPIVTPPGDNSWASGKPIMDGSRVAELLENNPAPDLNLHKPWLRTYLVLDASNGTEYTQDSDNDGFSEYAPFTWHGTASGSRQGPPVVNPNTNLLYQFNVYSGSNTASTISQGRVMGWKMGTSFYNIIGGQGAEDEPNSLSGGGSVIYRTICCDRVAEWMDVTSSSTGRIWDYAKPLITINSADSIAPDYDIMISSKLDTQWGVWPGHYGGRDATVAPHDGKNGIYTNSHGDQSPIIPYQGKLFVHRGNAILAFGPNTGPGKLPLLTINAATDTTVTPSDAQLKQRLEDEILKMDVDGDGKLDFLRPGYHSSGQADMYFTAYGQSELKNYYSNPGETIYSLTLAYPFLTSSTQVKVLEFLPRYFAAYFDPTMYSRIGWSEGAARESWPMTPEIQASMNQNVKSVTSGNPDWAGGNQWWSYPPQNYYAMWKYAALFPADATKVYNLAKAKIQVPTPLPDSTLTQYPLANNAYISGYIGLLNLQKLAGKDTVDATLKTSVTNELNRLKALRSSTFSADLQIPLLEHSRPYTISGNFIYMVPELGDYLNQSAKAKVQSAINDYNYVAPYWFVPGFEATEGEGVFEPLDSVTILQGRAYALKEPRETLAKFLETPYFARGDLYYIQNLVAVLNAPTTSPSGTPTATPSPSPSPSPLKQGDLDGNNKVDIFDYNILLTDFGKTGSNLPADIDKNGKVDIFDYNILLTNFGK